MLEWLLYIIKKETKQFASRKVHLPDRIIFQEFLEEGVILKISLEPIKEERVNNVRTVGNRESQVSDLLRLWCINMFCFHTGKEDYCGYASQLGSLFTLKLTYQFVNEEGAGVPEGLPENTIRAVSMRNLEGCTVISNGGNKIRKNTTQGAITPSKVIDFVLLIVEQAVGKRTYSYLNKELIVNTRYTVREGFSRNQDKNVKVVAHGASRKPRFDGDNVDK